MIECEVTINPIQVNHTVTMNQVSRLPAIGNWDWWNETFFGHSNVSASDFWLGSAILSGTNNLTRSLSTFKGYNPGGVILRGSVSNNGGYRYAQSSLAFYFGVVSYKFLGSFEWLTNFDQKLVRIGFFDTTTASDAVDGAYFEINENVCVCKTSNNSVRTTNPTSITLDANTPYVFDIEVNALGTEVRFRVYREMETTPILDVTNTTNIPTSAGRVFGSGIVATHAGNTSTEIGILYLLGNGTVPGFNRMRG